MTGPLGESNRPPRLELAEDHFHGAACGFERAHLHLDSRLAVAVLGQQIGQDLLGGLEIFRMVRLLDGEAELALIEAFQDLPDLHLLEVFAPDGTDDGSLRPILRQRKQGGNQQQEKPSWNVPHGTDLCKSDASGNSGT